MSGFWPAALSASTWPVSSTSQCVVSFRDSAATRTVAFRARSRGEVASVSYTHVTTSWREQQIACTPSAAALRPAASRLRIRSVASASRFRSSGTDSSGMARPRVATSTSWSSNAF